MSLTSVSAAVNNMELSVLCLLTVALAFVPPHSAQDVSFEKPGVCPDDVIGPLDGRIGPCPRQCSSDRGCKGTMKCCPSGCGRMCVEPVQVPLDKPGVCPKLLTPFVDGGACLQCSSDSECDGTMKCCYSGCGRMCMEPEKDEPKPGSCPRPAGFGICVSTCSSDRECEKDLKCCSNGCGTTCMKPDVPVEKPGVCPKFRSPFEGLTPYICPRQCSSDSECEGTKKCCPGRCGSTCVEPEQVVPKPKPGTCPVPHDIEICVECTTDRDCERNFKCCTNGCVKSCMEPIGRRCPRPPFVACDDCTDDSQCIGNLKCCYNNCERRRTCVEPVREPKPGSCPRPIPHLRPCDELCSDDYECPMNLKCCYSGCGNRCMPPV